MFIMVLFSRRKHRRLKEERTDCSKKLPKR